MRKITQDSVAAFFAGNTLHKQNMAVDTSRFRTHKRVGMFLHGNMIAERVGEANDCTIHLNDCGWQTPTTFDRLNGILDTLNLPRIGMVKGQADIDGCVWLGYERIQVRDGRAYFG